MNRIQKIPDPTHPITITPTTDHVVVSVGDTVIADTRSALSLQEASYPAVLYIPREDVQSDVLAESSTQTYCPYKGEASYVTFRADGSEVADVAWRYEQPYPAVAEIAGHLAFYPDRVKLAVEQG